MSHPRESRRRFVKAVAYTAPLIATATARPTFAAVGSGPPHCNNGIGNGADCLPNGLVNNGKTFLNNDD